jgi:CheY-like chemotaxis protein
MAKIFFVEDDVSILRLYAQAFTLSGHDVVLASNGEEALEKLKTMVPKPDIILLDMMMPKLNGFEVLKVIKKDAALKDIMVVVLTNMESLAGGRERYSENKRTRGGRCDREKPVRHEGYCRAH